MARRPRTRARSAAERDATLTYGNGKERRQSYTESSSGSLILEFELAHRAQDRHSNPSESIPVELIGAIC